MWFDLRCTEKKLGSIICKGLNHIFDKSFINTVLSERVINPDDKFICILNNHLIWLGHRIDIFQYTVTLSLKSFDVIRGQMNAISPW